MTESLSRGACICLFPEGGSHDRSDLLPLKAGVAVMALTAQARMKELATVCNCHLALLYTYFYFRNRNQCKEYASFPAVSITSMAIGLDPTF